MDDSRRVIRRGLSSTLSRLQELNVRIWMLRQIPAQLHNPCSEYLTMARFGRTSLSRGVTLASYHTQLERFDDIVSQFATFDDLTVVDPAACCFDSDGYSRTGRDGLPFYADGNHLSPVGATTLLAPLFEPVLQQIASASGRSRVSLNDPARSAQGRLETGRSVRLQ